MSDVSLAPVHVLLPIVCCARADPLTDSLFTDDNLCALGRQAERLIPQFILVVRPLTPAARTIRFWLSAAN